MELEIIEETKSWIAVNKPSGMLVEDNPFEASVESILKPNHKFIGIVHRLDRVTSGVLLLAKKRSTLKVLNAQFSDKKIKKTYKALVAKKPSKTEDTLTHYLLKDQKNKKAIVFKTERTNTFKVILHYRVIDRLEDNFILKVTPETGKFHQIRAQLAFMGCPIVGDTKYNNAINTDEHLKTIKLHAFSLDFINPENNQRTKLFANHNF